jgi:outer membrane protein OmpA-like peptidoglycan-associated protein
VSVDGKGVTFVFRYRERSSAGDSTADSASRFVSATDMASAPRLNTVFVAKQLEETPGYTAFTISRAVYNRVRAEHEVRYTTMGVDSSAIVPGVGGQIAARVPYRGTLSLANDKTETVPVLLNGRRVALPAIHLRGRFAYQERHSDFDLWVLADSANPLILKTTKSARTYQTVRIDYTDAEAGKMALHEMEGDLKRLCRMELPGVYFAFASAELEPASDVALERVAALLARHPDWSFTVEGHTDSIGNAAFNLTLSRKRAEAVRAALIRSHGVAPGRLQSTGYGSARPRETNATLEGRARNRRVELSRDCDGDRR